MERIVGNFLLCAIFAVLYVAAVAWSWNVSAKNVLGLPRLTVVAARPLAAGKEIERADLDIKVVWGTAAPASIGRVQTVVGLKIKSELKPGSRVRWADLESGAGKIPAAGGKVH